MLDNRDFETKRELGFAGAVGWSGLSSQRKVEHAIRHLTIEITIFSTRTGHINRQSTCHCKGFLNLGLFLKK